MLKRLAALLIVLTLVHPWPLLAQTIPEEEESVRQYICTPCILLPILVRSVLKIYRPLGVPANFRRTAIFTGQIVDTVTHASGHPRILFGTADDQVTADKCDVTLAGDDPAKYHGVANIRYTFDDGSYTYLPDTENLPSLAPMAGWRLNVLDEPKLVDLETSLRSEGFTQQANVLRDLIQAGGVIYVAQLNRGSIAAYSLDASLDAAHKYQLVCHSPVAAPQ
jgi:hypothetical protein